MNGKEKNLEGKKWIGPNTIIMMILFVVIFAALGAFLGFLIHLVAPSFHWAYGMLILIVIAVIVIIMTIFSIRNDIDNAIEESKKQSGRYPELESTVAELSSKAVISTPYLLVESNKDPNAYALGFKDKSIIIVNDSLLNVLDLNEVKGVLAHEISHIKDGDTFTTAATTRLSNIISLFSKYIGVTLFLSSFVFMKEGDNIKTGGSGNGNIFALLIQMFVLAIGLAMFIIGGILCIFYPLAKVLKMAISRDREYNADKSAAYLTKEPRALANALGKLNGITVPDEEICDKNRDMMFIDHHSSSFVNNILLTHPPAEKRIKRLIELESKV